MTKTPKWLQLATERCSERPWTLAAVFAAYCRDEGLSREQLAGRLGCDLDSLAWLSLCRRPAPEKFVEDVSKIAERVKIAPLALAQVLRRVDAIAALRRPMAAQEVEQLLLAARDRDEEKET